MAFVVKIVALRPISVCQYFDYSLSIIIPTMPYIRSSSGGLAVGTLHDKWHRIHCLRRKKKLTYFHFFNYECLLV